VGLRGVNGRGKARQEQAPGCVLLARPPQAPEGLSASGEGLFGDLGILLQVAIELAESLAGSIALELQAAHDGERKAGLTCLGVSVLEDSIRVDRLIDPPLAPEITRSLE